MAKQKRLIKLVRAARPGLQPCDYCGQWPCICRFIDDEEEDES